MDTERLSKCAKILFFHQSLEELQALQSSFNTRLHVEWPRYRNGILNAAQAMADTDEDLKRLLHTYDQGEEGLQCESVNTDLRDACCTSKYNWYNCQL